MSTPTPTPELPVFDQAASSPSFDLRCRDAEWIDHPATVEEFAAPAPLADPYAGVAELLIADMVARAQTELGELLAGRVLLSCERPRFGIPVGVHDLDRLELDDYLHDWHIRERLDLELLEPGPDGRLQHSVAAQFRRGLLAIAGALPLLASPMLAHAHAPVDPGNALARALSAAAPPSLPQDPAPATQPSPAAPQSPTAAPPVATPATTPVTPTADPQAAPSAAPPPRIAADTLTLTGTDVWVGLLGKRVALAMKNGQSVDGTLVAQSSSDLALARSSDGTVVSVPKLDIAGVRLVLQAYAGQGGSEVPLHQRPTDDGMRLYGGGAAMIGIGSTVALAGTVMLGIYVSALYISLPLLLPGLAMIGGGASMMSSASKKRKAVNRAWGIPQTSRLQMVPTVAGGRNGGQAGLILRF
jgi:hypothetical protein